MRVSRKIQDELVSSAKAGDTNAINELIVKLQPMIKRAVDPYASHVRDNKFDHYFKDELVSECNLYIYKLIDKYKIGSKATFFTYAYSNFLGVAKMYFRKEYKNLASTYNKSNKLLDEFSEDFASDAHGHIVDKDAKDPAVGDKVNRLIDILGIKDYELMHLYYGEGYTMEEIAYMYGTNKMNISRRISKLLKSLKNKNNLRKSVTK